MKHLMIVAFSVLALCASAASPIVHAQAKPAAAPKAMTATGLVKSVSANQFVIDAGGKDMTFMVASTTTFTGKGLTTKSKGNPMPVTDTVHEGDRVTVSYHDVS